MSKWLLLLFVVLGSARALANATAPSIDELSSDLDTINAVSRKQFGTDHIYIGGGTARSVIRSVFLKEPLTFRDFDTFIVADRQVTAQMAEKLGRAIDAKGVGEYSELDLRPRPRPNPQLPPPASYNHNAGFGFFVFNKSDVLHDISVYHSDYDLSLNGMFDVDTIRVRLPVGTSLKTVMNLGPESFKELIEDPYNSLKTVLGNGRPRLVHWQAVESDPQQQAIRAVRTLGKFDAFSNGETFDRKMKKLIAKSPPPNILQICRNLGKLLEDPAWFQELTLLKEWGLFDRIFPSLKGVLEINGEWLRYDVNRESDWKRKVVAFVSHMDDEEKLVFLRFITKVEPDLLVPLLSGISRSHLKIGYFTGEFAPFTEGHLSVAKSAIEKGGLDFVFIIPTPFVTNDPKVKRFDPEEWAERRAFVEAGTKNEPNIMLWAPPDTGRNQTTDMLVNELERELGGYGRLTHVMGADSFHRVVYRGLLWSDKRPRIVVTRSGVELPDEAFNNRDVRVVENLNPAPISASTSLGEMAAGKEPKYLSPAVKNLVLQMPRYKQILADLREEAKDTDKNLRRIGDVKNKIFILDPRENNAGLGHWDPPKFSEFHVRLIRRLAAMQPKQIVIHINTSDTELREGWEKGVQKLRLPNVVIKERYASIPRAQRVMVLHSGLINGAMSGYYLSREHANGVGLIVFETPDYPMSSLGRQLKKPLILPTRRGRCPEVVVGPAA